MRKQATTMREMRRDLRQMRNSISNIRRNNRLLNNRIKKLQIHTLYPRDGSMEDEDAFDEDSLLHLEHLSSLDVNFTNYAEYYPAEFNYYDPNQQWTDNEPYFPQDQLIEATWFVKHVLKTFWQKF